MRLGVCQIYFKLKSTNRIRYCVNENASQISIDMILSIAAFFLMCIVVAYNMYVCMWRSSLCLCRIAHC